MTVNQLYKRLGKLIEDGDGRKRVLVAKDTFRDNCESDGVTILPVEGLGIKWILTADGDGGTKYGSDGTECGSYCCILAGGSGANMKGELVEESPNSD